MPTTGLQLKLERTARRVRGNELARAMNVHPSRVTYLEGRDIVPETAAEKYRAALATLPTVATSEASA